MNEPLLPVARWTNHLVDLLQQGGSPLLDAFSQAAGGAAESIQAFVTAVPAPVSVLAFGLVGWWRRGWGVGALAILALSLIHAMGYGAPLMVTLAQVLIATATTLVIGIPTGIFLSTRPVAAWFARPLLDSMQTMPAFVYLIPAAMLFGLGLVPALLATVIFALPPVVRLTMLGLRQVPVDVLEAARTLGAEPRQVLLRVKLPAARPAIMAGVSQTIMMALSMVIIASMVGAGGLGSEVLSAIQRLDVGQGVASGLCVVLLAIVIDRITEGGEPKRVSSSARVASPSPAAASPIGSVS